MTASIDKNAKVLDSRTGKLIYNKNIEDKGTQSSLFWKIKAMLNFLSTGCASSACFIWEG